MIGDSQWIEGFLYKVMARAAELINQQAYSFRDSLERWLALNWPVLMLPGWEVRFNNFLSDWRADGVILQPESAQQLFDYLNAQSEQMRADGVQLPEQLPTLQSLLPTREQALRPADERHFPDDLPAPFDPAYPQLRRTGNSIMQRYPPEDWLRRAEQVLKSYRVPEEIPELFLEWLAAEQKKRTAPAVQSAAGLESLGPSDLHPYAICFVAGTPILTCRGEIAIEHVVAGDEALAVPETDPFAPARWRRVERAYHNAPAELIDIHVAGLPVIRATLNHPFFVWGKGFISAQRLGTGDLLRTADDRWLPVSETRRDGAIQPVYNLCVAECHTYFAGGVLVHNQSPAANAQSPGANTLLEPDKLNEADEKSYVRWLSKLQNQLPPTNKTPGARADLSKFRQLQTINRDAAIGIRMFNGTTENAILYLTIDVIQGVLVVTVRKGQPSWGRDSFGRVITGDPGDPDSAQVGVQWGANGLAETNANRNGMAADWAVDPNLTPLKGARIYGKAETTFKVPPNATSVNVVVVYTDLIKGTPDVPGVIASWAGTKNGNKWTFTLNEADMMRWYGADLTPAQQLQTLQQTKKVVTRMGLKLKRRHINTINSGYDMSQ